MIEVLALFAFISAVIALICWATNIMFPCTEEAIAHYVAPVIFSYVDGLNDGLDASRQTSS